MVTACKEVAAITHMLGPLGFNKLSVKLNATTIISEAAAWNFLHVF